VTTSLGTSRTPGAWLGRGQLYSLARVESACLAAMATRVQGVAGLHPAMAIAGGEEPRMRQRLGKSSCDVPFDEAVWQLEIFELLQDK